MLFTPEALRFQLEHLEEEFSWLNFFVKVKKTTKKSSLQLSPVSEEEFSTLSTACGSPNQDTTDVDKEINKPIDYATLDDNAEI